MGLMIAVIDNYDSFVHNLARYLRQLGRRTEVLRNDAVTVDQLAAMQPEAIVIGWRWLSGKGAADRLMSCGSSPTL